MYPISYFYRLYSSIHPSIIHIYITLSFSHYIHINVYIYRYWFLDTPSELDINVQPLLGQSQYDVKLTFLTDFITKKVIEGHKMYLDPDDGGISKALVRHGFREACFMWILRHEAEGVAVDVGANIGYCTLSLADTCEKVYAYEPDPRSYKLLEMNAKKLSNVIIIPKAITADGKPVHISLAEKPNLSSICIDGEGITVESVQLKDHLPEAVYRQAYRRKAAASVPHCLPSWLAS